MSKNFISKVLQDMAIAHFLKDQLFKKEREIYTNYPMIIYCRPKRDAKFFNFEFDPTKLYEFKLDVNVGTYYHQSVSTLTLLDEEKFEIYEILSDSDYNNVVFCETAHESDHEDYP